MPNDADIGLPIELRDPMESDLNYIRTTWLRSYATSRFASPIGKEDYFSNHKEIVNSLLFSCPLTIACLPDQREHVLGWMVFNVEPSLIHYIFVGPRYRRFGVAKKMMSVVPGLGTTNIPCSHWPSTDTLIEKSKSRGLSYLPYLMLSR